MQPFKEKKELKIYAAKKITCACGCGRVVTDPYARNNGDVFATRTCWEADKAKKLQKATNES